MLILKTQHGSKLTDMCTSHNLGCLIKEPTRITDRTATILDQIIPNAPNFVKKVDVSPPVSTNDHCTVSAMFTFNLNKEEPYLRIVWLYNPTDYIEFRELLASADFDKCFEHNNIDLIAKRWIETFLNIARTSIPNKVVTVRPNDSPWYTSTLVS